MNVIGGLETYCLHDQADDELRKRSSNRFTQAGRHKRRPVFAVCGCGRRGMARAMAGFRAHCRLICALKNMRQRRYALRVLGAQWVNSAQSARERDLL